MIAALTLALALHTHPALASRLTCYRLHRAPHCVKTPLWQAKHAAVGVWVKHERRYIHHKWRRVTVTFPVLHAPAKPVSYGTYTTTMLVTYYTDVGLMADGTETYFGAAACGYDLPFGARVHIAGVPGLLTCHDRIGFDPFRHIDVWGYRPGLGMDVRLVTVYR